MPASIKPRPAGSQLLRRRSPGPAEVQRNTAADRDDLLRQLPRGSGCAVAPWGARSDMGLIGGGAAGPGTHSFVPGSRRPPEETPSTRRAGSGVVAWARRQLSGPGSLGDSTGEGTPGGRLGMTRNVRPVELEIRDADEPDQRGATGRVARGLDKLYGRIGELGLCEPAARG